jgi:carboxypeptidase Q
VKIKSLYLLFLLPKIFYSQTNDSLFIRESFNLALKKGNAYTDLRSLCKDIGSRLSGSAEAQMAVEWSYVKMKSYGFDSVYLQEIKVPHWERGTKEAGWIKSEGGELTKVSLLALGGSVGTNGILEGSIIEFNSLQALKEASKADVNGKIVFLNQEMDETQINTFKAYGGCYPIRGDGAIEAAKLGAIAVIIRSLAMPIDNHPHTGSMHYDDAVDKIPAAAISTADAEFLSELLKVEKANFILEMDCRIYPDATSYNVIAEIKGNVNPNNIITFGGHLDSWDAGEGAHDDGAGVIHCMEALRIIKEIGYNPKNTLRVVFFMNEENGNMGGKSYATWVKEKGENQIAALESDRGGFSPHGFSCDGTGIYLNFLDSIAHLFSPYEMYEFDKGYGGVDIGPLKDVYEGIPLFGFVPDSQRYFDFHHAPSDIFENVNKRELELGAGAIASFVYLMDKYLVNLKQ